MALDLASENITVNAVCPGPTATPMSDGYFEDAAERAAFFARLPLRRRADPAEIAGAVQYLLSDAARYVTGTSLVVDGGYLAQ
jgi:NAD(P)-dependent dehydrogenase (short-subunit alcohol dehydrogenase family)